MRRRWIAGGLALLTGLLAWVAGMPEPEPGGPGAEAAPPAVWTAETRQPIESGATTPAATTALTAAAPDLGVDADPAARAAAQRDALGGCGSGRPTLSSWASTVVEAAAVAAGQAVDRLGGRGAAADPQASIADLAAAAATAQAEMARLQPESRARVDRLAQGGPLAQAAALLLRETLDEQAQAEAAQAGRALPAAPGAGVAAGAPDIIAESLLRIARDSGSLPVLRLALGVCQQRRSCGGASDLLLQDWAQREADNAAPWLTIADVAQRRGDAQAADDAVYRASQATRMDSQVMALLAVLAEPAFDVAGGAASAQLQMMWVGIVMAQPLAEPSVVLTYCHRKRLADANLAQRCDALARLLVERDGTLLGMVIGRGLGERLGWPQDRLAAIDERRLAVQQRSIQATAGMDPLACRQQASLRQEMLGVARHGEVGYQLQRMAAAGESVAGLAAAARTREAAMMAAAREAAAREARAAPAASASAR